MSNDTQQTIIELTDEQVSAALAEFDITEATLEKIRKYKDFTVDGPGDKKNVKIAKSKYKKIRQLRIDIDKKRKEIIRPALDFQSAVNDEAKRLTGEVKPVEDHLKEVVDKVKREEEALKAKKMKERRQKLIDAGYKFDGQFYALGELALHPSALTDADEETIDQWLRDGKRETERMEREEAERKAEAERIRKEKEKLEKDRRELEAEKKKIAREKAEAKTTKQTAPPAETKPAETRFKEQKSAPVMSNPPAPPARSNNQADKTAASSEINTFEDGFSTAQEVIMKTVKKGTLPNGDKITRRKLYDWIKSLDPETHKTPF